MFINTYIQHCTIYFFVVFIYFFSHHTRLETKGDSSRCHKQCGRYKRRNRSPGKEQGGWFESLQRGNVTGRLFHTLQVGASQEITHFFAISTNVFRCNWFCSYLPGSKTRRFGLGLLK